MATIEIYKNGGYLMDNLTQKCKKAYASWRAWDSYELGRKGELYYNYQKMEFGLIQHSDRTSKGYISDAEFWIPVASFICEIEDRFCRAAKSDEIIAKIEKYVRMQLEKLGVEI